MARRLGRVLAASSLVLSLLFAVALAAGCTPESKPAESEEETATVGAAMAGPVVDVNVTQEALDSKPAAPVLTNPESSVRSFLDWTSYAYRTAQSQAALPVMTTYEEVRVDSYIQYNIQKLRLLDQTLVSVTFGRVSIEGSTAVVPTRETWTYNYVSIEDAGKVIGGPYDASYDATYTVVQTESGWKVDKVESTALGKVE